MFFSRDVRWKVSPSKIAPEKTPKPNHRMASGLLTLLSLTAFAVSGCTNLRPPTASPADPLAAPLASTVNKNDFALDPDCFVSIEEFDSFAPIASPDLWARVRSGYKLASLDNQRIDQQLKWYTRHPSYLTRVTKRSEPYMFHIVEQLQARDMPMEIALLPIVESAFDPFAYSHGRASGMWQIVPGTGKYLGLKQNWWYDGRRDVVASTDAALRYLQRLNKRFDGDWLLALAAYNSGAGNVSKAIRKNKKRGLDTNFWQLDLPQETKTYVPRLLALTKLFAKPNDYNITLTSVANEPYFAEIEIGSQIDLAQAATLADIPMDVLYHLNPGFNRWATDPKGPHKLLVPAAKAQSFTSSLAAIPEDERVTWNRYTIKDGDSLSTIAKKFNISIGSLKSVNELRSSRIRAGKTLMVPVAAKSTEHYSYSVSERLAKRHASVSKKNKGHKLNYTVKSGDSLWTISRQHKVSVAKLARWNNMAPKDPIRPGQHLKIWTSTPKTSESGVIRKVSYKVRSGDSLARIAKKFRLNIGDILKWNQIQKSKYLQPGQSLTLFVDVTKSHET